MSGKNSIQVAIKVRPLLNKDKDQPLMWRIADNSIQLIDSQTEPYYFDHIFDQDANNQIIFDKMAKQIVHSAIQGFNGTIFAYGQTSSGKTYTMMGDEDNPGVMVLAAKEIFKEIERTQDRQFLLRVGYIEIYNEKIYDLLNKKNQDLKIHETSTGSVIVNCEEVIIRSEDDLLAHLDKGGKERTVGETNMNERSSRSHAIFRIIIESRKMERSEDDAVTQSVINLVDLAGSERADQTGARGARLKEGGHINKSLLFLGTVIKRLSENEDDKFISFRDSKLTRILQASLGGNALTAIICTIKINAVEETQSTLSFALRAKSVKNKPQVNEIVSDATMMKRLEHEIKMLKLRLEEEQRKNESQIKVRQLEQRIRNEDLKIISSNSLHSIRKNEKRRRTWCPSSTNLDSVTVNQQPSALPVPVISSDLSSGQAYPSRLQQPKSLYNTPLITMRLPTEPLPSLKMFSELAPTEDIPENYEVFVPSELANFEMISPLPTPHNLQLQSKTSVTPKLLDCTRSTLEKVERDFLELQSFTNLENKVEVHHEPDLALKQKIETLTQRNTVLENERLEYLQLKNELEMTTESLNGAQIRCDELQAELSQLKNLNEAAAKRIANYEEELAALKKANEKLEMENREAISLEFEFSRHKNKSELREHELLEALNDKDKEITKLEKSLKALSAELLQNSKEELMQKTLNEGGAVDEDGKTCVKFKSEDLQRLLEENKSITSEFKKLTLECEKLKLNCIEIEKENEEKKLQILHLEELQAKEKAESEKLLLDVQQLREKLQTVQRDYDQLNSENALKHKECMELNRQVEVAKQEMVMLEEKFTKLELSWQAQQKNINDIETQYATIQTKYENLQIQYEQLENSRGISSSDCQRLEKENLDLQTEIEDLKRKVNDTQQKLLESNDSYEKTAKATETETETANEEKISKVQQENEQLKNQLLEIQTKFEDLQQECDALSNQLMDNIQECENVKNENTKLKEKCNDFEDMHKGVVKTEVESSDFRSQLEKELLSNEQQILKTSSPLRNSLMRRSAVCVKGEEEFVTSPETQDLLIKFCELSESLSEIELEYTEGKKKLFKSACKNSTPTIYKMYLKNILGVHTIQKQFEMEMENMHLQGSFEHHSFHIAEVCDEKKSDEIECNKIDANDCANTAEYIKKLEKEIMELKIVNEQERLSNKSLVENTERALSEMREQITQLSAELLEKSIFVENCSCKISQQHIENVEKEKANSSLSGFLNDHTNNTTSSEAEIKTVKDNNNLTEIEELKVRKKELIDSFDPQTKSLEEMSQRCIEMETELESALQQLRIQEKEFKEKHNQLQLEILQKLELSANEYRDNMKKYNKEWEEKRDEYEQTIKDLQNQIDVLKQSPVQIECFNKSIKQENISDNNEISDKIEMLEYALTPSSEACLQDINFSKDIEAFKQIKYKLEEENLSLQQQLNTAENLTTKIKEENATQSEQITLLEFKVVSLEQQLADVKFLHTTITNENDSLKTQINNFKKDQSRLPDLHAKNQQLSDKVERLTTEFSELQDKYQKAEIKINELCKEEANSQLQIELKATKESLAKLSEDKQTLQEKLIHYQSLQEDNNKLEATLNALKKTHTGALKSLQEEKEQLRNNLLQYEKQQEEFKEKEETLKLKIELLSQQLYEMRGKASLYEELLQEHDELEGILTSTTAEKQKLQQEISQLTSQQEASASQIENQTSEIEKLNYQLNKLTSEKDELQTKLSHLKEILQGLKKEHSELKSSFEELKLKCDSLEMANKQLESVNKQTEQQINSAKESLKEFNCMQEQLNLLKIKHNELQLTLKTTLEEAERSSLTLREDVDHYKQLLQQQLEKYNLLKAEMETKQESLSRTLSSSIETLQKEKSVLEEKLRELAVRNFEQDLQRQAIDAIANISADSNSSHSPKERKSLERMSIDNVANIKLSAIQQKHSTTAERKNRRLNTHDERRRQSYWGAVYDKETMTDPVDTSCNCIELDQKLQECERNLFIKTSQVTTLNMQLKNHPLKEENTTLKKRLQEEQALHLAEIKRYKSKLYEQTAKAEKALAAAAHATAKSTHATLAAEQQVAPAIPKVVCDVEAQTDDELSASFEKLQSKYNDLKNICRHRYNVIKELEEKVAQKENSDGNSLSAHDSVKFKMMSNQCESLKTEMEAIKKKYVFAKQVLQSRREEIARLRAQLEEAN